MYLFLINCLLFAINVNSNQWDGYHRQIDDELPPISWKDCGISSRQSDSSPNPTVSTRIEGGEYAKSGEFPWFAELQIHKYSSKRVGTCGGSIINEWWILTAGHCVEPSLKIKRISVLIGSVNVFDESVGRHIDVERVVIHSEYLRTKKIEGQIEVKHKNLEEELIQWKKSGKDITEEFKNKLSKYMNDSINMAKWVEPSSYYDIALLKLRERIIPVRNETHYTINSICLPKTNIMNEGNESQVIIGTGMTALGSAPSPLLKKGVVFMLEAKNCIDERVDDGLPRGPLKPLVCLQRENISDVPLYDSGSCRGDSGAPSHQYYGLKAVQIGIASKISSKDSKICSTIEFHTRVSHHMPWIRSIISGIDFETEAKPNHLLIVSVITTAIIAVIVCSALIWISVKILKSRPRID